MATDDRTRTSDSSAVASPGSSDTLPSGRRDESGQPGHGVGPGDCVGRYTIRALIGSGGMGQVFAAFDAELGRTVALKIIRPDANGPSWLTRTRFQREAQALARLRHANIVTVHDVGTQGDRLFIAMELVEGETLTDWLGARKRSWREVRDTFLAAGRGLAAAHAVGIVHRDFKPANVIVGQDRVVVVDFGLARTSSDEPDHPEGDASLGTNDVLALNLTLSGERLGTPLYMAPEQLRGEPADARSDQYSFCVALWEALHGERPSADVDAGAPRRREVPGSLSAAVRRGLRRDPAARWPSMATLLSALDHDPVVARRRIWVATAVVVFAVAAAWVLWRRPTPSPSVVNAANALASAKGPPPPVRLVERRLTADPPGADWMEGSISRDGRLLAWLRQGILSIRVLGTGDERRLPVPAGSLFSVSWFPDGSHLLVSEYNAASSDWTVRAAAANALSADLKILSTLSGVATELVQSACCGAVSPDGTTIAYYHFASADRGALWLADADGQHPRKLADVGPGNPNNGFIHAPGNPNNWFIHAPVWSPGGRGLALALRDPASETLELRIVSIDGRLGPPIVQGPDLADAFGGVSCTWLDDGRLVYARQRREESDLWALAVDPTTGERKGEPVLAGAFLGHSTRLLDTDERQDLLTLRVVHGSNVNVFDLSAGGEPRPITQDEWQNFPSSFSDDGKDLLFQSLRNGRWQRYRVAVAGGLAIAEPTSEHDSMEARPMPGGKRLLWLESTTVGDSNQWRLLARSNDGVASVVAELGSLPAVSGTGMTLRCARGAGNACVLARHDSNASSFVRFTRIDPESGAESDIATVKTRRTGWALSPAGDELAYPSDGRVIAISVSDGATRLSSSIDDLFPQFLAYAPSRQTLIVTGIAEGRKNLYRVVSLDRRGRARLLWGNDDDWLSSPVVSPDGRYLAFSRVTQSRNLWLLSGL